MNEKAYLVIKNGSITKRYECAESHKSTNTAPYMKIKVGTKTNYINLTTQTTTGVRLQLSNTTGQVNTTSTRSSTYEVVDGYEGVVNTTFTTGYTGVSSRKSTSGYTGSLSKASTSGYTGVSSRKSTSGYTGISSSAENGGSANLGTAGGFATPSKANYTQSNIVQNKSRTSSVTVNTWNATANYIETKINTFSSSASVANKTVRYVYTSGAKTTKLVSWGTLLAQNGYHTWTFTHYGIAKTYTLSFTMGTISNSFASGTTTMTIWGNGNGNSITYSATVTANSKFTAPSLLGANNKTYATNIHRYSSAGYSWKSVVKGNISVKYYSQSPAVGNLSNTTALTRQSNYNSSSVNVGNLSSTTALTKTSYYATSSAAVGNLSSTTALTRSSSYNTSSNTTNAGISSTTALTVNTTAITSSTNSSNMSSTTAITYETWRESQCNTTVSTTAHYKPINSVSATITRTISNITYTVEVIREAEGSNNILNMPLNGILNK